MTQDANLDAILERTRKELLDISTRNRLLNTPRTSSRSTRLEIVDELSERVFRRLVVDEKPMSFLARPETPAGDDESDAKQDDEYSLAQPSDDEAALSQLVDRHADNKLHTTLDSEHLQKRLLKLFYDARTYEEEQGVSILYLALGFLKWYEAPSSERERYAPLILVPVKLDRQSATSNFKVAYNDDELATNLSLQARLKDDFGIELPDLPELDDLSPLEYFDEVSRAVQGKNRWEVLPNDIVLWFFSFSKFLMYRDLQPDNWPSDRSLNSHPIIRGLLQESFSSGPPICGDDDNIDDLISPSDAPHVVDADSSQTLAIEEVKRGRNLVIQGPPGTGKSQTIANIVSAAVVDGKSVLFVAEKMAALDVVHRRLANIGLGEMCLELHSKKANKKAVLQDLKSALQLKKPASRNISEHCRALTQCRSRLNHHLHVIHEPFEPSGFTPFQIIGELVRLRAAETRPPAFRLQSPEAWTRSEWTQRKNLLRDLVEHLEEIGQPDRHPWRGVTADVFLPTDVDRMVDKCRVAIKQGRELLQASGKLAQGLRVSAPTTLQDVSRLSQLAQHLANAPPMDQSAMAADSWSKHREQIDELICTGQTLSECQRALEGTVIDTAWDTDLTPVRQNLAAYGRSWYRVFVRAYREAQATLRGFFVDLPPKDINERLGAVDILIRGQKAKATIESRAFQELAADAFGGLWNGMRSDWNSLDAVSRWEASCRDANVPSAFRKVMSRLNSQEGIFALLQPVEDLFHPFVENVRAIVTNLHLDLDIAFGDANDKKLSISELLDRFELWVSDPEGLSHWVAYSNRRHRLANEGLEELVDELHSGATEPDEAVARCEMAYYEALVRKVFKAYPDLAAFNGSSHEKLLDKFCQLDEERIHLARYEVARAHYDRIPKAESSVGELGIVRRETEKKRRHKPIRKLLAEAGRAVQAIKPVFMMSPLSVAQYLEPGAIDFDLLLIDEASQVQPVDALGAIARAKQIVVVGDSRQLPPTNFFSRMLGEQAEDDSDLNAGDVESVLGLCCAQNVPQRMLRWHYRSRHHSLIAVSNREFYENKLYVVPSPGNPSENEGLVFNYVADGTFDRGASRANRVEAKKVANAVMEHARSSPNQTLGVGTFSVAQRDAILDELELLRRKDTSLEAFFSPTVAEPFFVKNLENIQGDERDVILISVGYGKTTEGYMAMSFGPLSNDGGERRLNVLITRARDCCKVFSSIRSDDIDTARAKARGAQALKTFLRYAELGIIDADAGHGDEHDSEFERQVAVALRKQGFEIHPQVGVAGFFIDLAVVDPECAGRYLIGIECDGANYHSSRSARDRDRIRQAVLESRGWTIHRIWSTDWFHRPDDEMRKVLKAVEQARIEIAGKGGTAGPSNVPTEPDVLELAREEGTHEVNGNGIAVEPYEVAAFRVKSELHIHELPTRELAEIVSKIIRIESPIHRDEITRRVTRLWGLTRAGKRIQEAVTNAIPLAQAENDIVVEGEFLYSSRRDAIRVRDRSEVDLATLRKPEMLPPLEVRQAVAAIVEVHHGATENEIIVEVARLFGYKSTSAQLRNVIGAELSAMRFNRELEERNGKLYVAASNGSHTPDN